MSGDGPRRGLKSYLATLVATIVFPLLWLQAFRLARRHVGDDARAPLKVGVAIVLGLGIIGAGAYGILVFQADAQAGMYDSLQVRLASAVGEAEYQEALTAIAVADGALPKIEANLANATSDAKRAELEAARDATLKARDDAVAKVALLGPNHLLFGRIEQAVADQDDARIRALFAEAPAYPKDSAVRADAALAIKDGAAADMQQFSWLFIWPSLVGAFFAPMAFALGSILRKSFKPSDTVGFKPYPGAAAGLFLILGAFGLPAVPFAAWTFNDAMGRSEEGQIAL